MSLHLNSAWDKVAIFYDEQTGEAGLAINAVADETIAKGNVLSYIQGGTENRVKKTPATGNENDMPIGVALSSANAGDSFWMAISGNVQVLPEATIAPTLGYLLYTSQTTAGTVNQAALAPAGANHFKECGHWSETKTAGTLAKATIHFN